MGYAEQWKQGKGKMMGHYIDAAYGKIFGTVVVRGQLQLAEEQDPKEQTFRTEYVKAVLVIMSRRTERELMREDFGNTSGICGPRVYGQPTRIFGTRVAFDDSLADGEFLVCERAY